MDKLALVSGTTCGLIIACEDIVEEGSTPEHLEAMKRALTYTQGQKEYWPRAHRW